MNKAAEAHVAEVGERRDASPSDISTEVLVLGSGPGGYTAAFRAADLGKRTLLVERHDVLGGVCLNAGCIPSKALLHIARVIDEAAQFRNHGIRFGEPEIDVASLVTWKDRVVSRLTRGLAQLARQRKVEVLNGSGRFTSAHRMEISTAEGVRNVSFQYAIIAAGSHPAEIPGLLHNDPRIMDSAAALRLETVPERLLVVGGGIIGLELATVYDALGSRVTVVEVMDRLIPACDPDLVQPLERRIGKKYENIHLQTRVTGIEMEEASLRVFLDGPKAPEEARFDRALIAVGRQPNGHLIGAEAAGVHVGESGVIEVDEEQRTNVRHIFAIGDIAGEPMLAHKATHGGKVAAEVIAGLKSTLKGRVIPNVAYTDPEIAWVGIGEPEARKRELDYGKAVFPWAASGRALTMGRDEGLTKVLFDNASHRVIGAGIVGLNAGDLISELVLAIEMGCSAQDISLTVHPHPTLSETVAMAAAMFEGTITDLYAPKK